MTAPKGAAKVIAALLAQAGLDLPVRLRAWDGSEAGALEPLDSPVLVARSPRALQRILWRPGELGLARAYVSGDLDVEGDLTDGLHRVYATAPRSGPFGLIKTGPAAVAAAARLGLLAPLPGPPGCELRVRGRRHSRARPGGDRRPLRRAVRVLPAHRGPEHGLLVRVLGRPAGSQRSAAGANSRPWPARC
jgi:cyclopropane-fatty-acyl-phospholipid synthase